MLIEKPARGDFLPILDSMMTGGLVTLEKVQVLQYGEEVKHQPA